MHEPTAELASSVESWIHATEMRLSKYADQAKYYNNPPNVESLIEEIRDALTELRDRTEGALSEARLEGGTV